jgi:hypothetical protein
MIQERATAVCATCEQPLLGPYCSNCGEKKLDQHDRRIIHLFEEVIHSLTHADSKFLRSFKYLFTRPGFLTSEYLAGRRKGYSSPLSLFFIANLLILFFARYDTFNSQFETVIQGQPYSQALMPQVRDKMEQRHWTRVELGKRYNEKSSHEAKLLLIVFVILVSLPTALLFISRKNYYYDYVVFATEYVNFIMYMVMLLLPGVVYLVLICLKLIRHGQAVHIEGNTPFVYGSILLLLWVYLAIAARRVFRQRWSLTIIKAAALTFCTVLAMFFYRFLAFEVTMFLL